MKKSVYDTIRTGLQNGVYKGVRLIRRHDTGEREVLIPFSKIGAPEQAIARFEHIKLQLDRKLEPGNYIIECKTGHTRGSLSDEFEVLIKAPVMIPVRTSEPKTEDSQEQIIDKTEEQENMQQIDFHDYLELVKENEKLKAQNALLLTQLEMERNNKSAPLNDSAPVTTSDKIFSALNDNLPMVLGIFDKFMTQRDKQLELQERQLNHRQGKKIMPSKAKPKINPDDVVEELRQLEQTDPHAFESALDALEVKNPTLYEYCCNALGLFDDEDYTEETGEEEQE